MTAENETCHCDDGLTTRAGNTYACADCEAGDAWADAAYAEDQAAFDAGNAMPLREVL